MKKEPEDWSPAEVAAFFKSLEGRDAGMEDLAIVERLLAKKVAEGKALLAARARKMN
jgi:hypothetical protein